MKLIEFKGLKEAVLSNNVHLGYTHPLKKKEVLETIIKEQRHLKDY